SPLDLAEQRQPIHAGHVDVGQDDDQLRPDAVAQHGQRRLAGAGEMQHIEALSYLPPELLSEQLRDIGLVIDNQDAHAHPSPPTAATRCTLGSRTVNSVNRPTSLSTAIDPPCCCVTMS